MHLQLQFSGNARLVILVTIPRILLDEHFLVGPIPVVTVSHRPKWPVALGLSIPPNAMNRSIGVTLALPCINTPFSVRLLR